MKPRGSLRRFARNNGLSLVMLALFLCSALGQAIAGFHAYNAEQREHHNDEIDYRRYLASPHFLEALFENWESEFLQMGAFVCLTVLLRQKGSPESLPVDDDADAEEIATTSASPWPARHGGWALAIYQYSLSIVLLLLFAAAFALHAIAGAAKYNASQLEHGGVPVSAPEYIATAEFWYESFQNWQSEFLSIGLLVVLSVYLRQKGSSQSKPVSAPHAQND